jgi:hypothetical protein
MKWKEVITNISTNLVAIIVYAQAVYPGLNAERIMAAWENGTIWNHIFNLALMYFLSEAGKRRLRD